MRLLFCGEQFPEAPKMLRRLLDDRDQLVVCPEEEVATSLSGVHILIPAMVRVTAKMLEAPDLRLVQQFATGVEGIDLDAARSRGVPVANIPAANAAAVAEVAVLHVISLLRGYAQSSANVRAGVLGVPLGRTLADRRVAVLGLGAVGREVLQRLLAFRPETVRVVSRRRAVEAGNLPDGVEYFPIDALTTALDGADVLIACIRHVGGSPPLIGAAEIAAMAPGSIIVNVARGGVLDRAAIEDSLQSRHLSGIGLDVFWHEPPDIDDALFDANVSLTGHIGGVSIDSYQQMASVVVDNVERLRTGRPVLNRLA
jgi:phosphoglycerate dehydrogenase-like enzyme